MDEIALYTSEMNILITKQFSRFRLQFPVRVSKPCGSLVLLALQKLFVVGNIVILKGSCCTLH